MKKKNEKKKQTLNRHSISREKNQEKRKGKNLGK